jgi:hypothetical protein
MLLLEMTSPPLPEIPGFEVIQNFADVVVAEEGPAILMWMVQGAMLDYADKDHKIFNALKQPMVDAARAYSRENSLYWQWYEEKMRIGPLDEVDIDLLEAFDQYRAWVFEKTKERCRDRRTDFKAALVAMFGKKIMFDIRTNGSHPGRAMIKGLGYAKQDFADAGNVVDIKTVRGNA